MIKNKVAMICTALFVRLKDKMMQKNNNKEKLYTALFDISNSAAWEWNLQTNGFRANSQWSTLTQQRIPESLSPEEFYKLFYPLDGEKDKREAFASFLDSKNEYYRDVSCIYKKGENTAKGIHSYYLLRDTKGRPMVLIGSLSIKAVEQKSKEFDALTSLPNRDSLLAEIRKDHLDSNKTLKQSIFLIININNFRHINSTYGYSNGDNILIQSGKRLKALQSKNMLISRGESSNFFVYISGLNHADEVDMLISQIYTVFKKPYYVNQADVMLTVSIGATQFYAHDNDVDQMIHNSFVALRRAKNQSQYENNFALFNQSMLIDAIKREKIIATLEKFKENGSLHLYFQPQFNTTDNKLHAFEALLRLEVNGIGVVSPSKFIPIAEETGIITEIGYWIVSESCQAIKRFENAGLDFTRMAVNVSLVQLIAPDFIMNIKQIIRDSGVDPSLLEFEITESVLMSSIEYSEDILRKLKEFGINIVLDDFGSGYSSLNYIRALSIDTLKIDKVFIDGICRDNKSKYIVEMVLNLAKQLELEVVAEGVETFEQLEILRRLGCPVIQGYYYSKPLSEEHILERYAGSFLSVNNN